MGRDLSALYFPVSSAATSSAWGLLPRFPSKANTVSISVPVSLPCYQRCVPYHSSVVKTHLCPILRRSRCRPTVIACTSVSPSWIVANVNNKCYPIGAIFLPSTATFKFFHSTGISHDDILLLSSRSSPAIFLLILPLKAVLTA